MNPRRSPPIVALSLSILVLAVAAAPASAPRLPIPGHWAGVILNDQGRIFPIRFVVSENRRNVGDVDFRLRITSGPAPRCGSFRIHWRFTKEKRLRDGRFRYHQTPDGTDMLLVGEVKDAPKKKANGTIRASDRASGCADTLEWTAFHVTR